MEKIIVICPACGEQDTFSVEDAYQEINCPTCWAEIIAEPTPETDPYVWEK